jgi:hypothetical protein
VLCAGDRVMCLVDATINRGSEGGIMGDSLTAGCLVNGIDAIIVTINGVESN